MLSPDIVSTDKRKRPTPIPLGSRSPSLNPLQIKELNHMQLLTAIATSAPRQVTTKYGERIALDIQVTSAEGLGQTATIWRGGNDSSPALRSIVNGSRLQVAVDSKGKFSLVETPADRAAQVQRAEVSPSIEPPARPMGFALNLPMEAERQLSRQLSAARPVAIESPVTSLGHLFQECLAVADGLVGEGDRVRVALALFDRLPQS
jgi:hypothetical protein